MIDKRKLQNWYNFQARFYSYWRDNYDLGVLQELASEIEVMNAPGPVLDLGCGSGLFSIGLAGRTDNYSTWVGIDFVRNFITIASGKAKSRGLRRINFIAGDVEKLPFKAESFGLAIAGGLFPNIESHDGVIDELTRTLREGATVYVVEYSSGLSPGMKWFIGLMILLYRSFTAVFRQFRFSDDWNLKKTFVNREKLIASLVRKGLKIESVRTSGHYWVVRAIRSHSCPN